MIPEIIADLTMEKTTSWLLFWVIDQLVKICSLATPSQEVSVTVEHQRASYLFHFLNAKQISVVRWADNSARWKYLKKEIAHVQHHHYVIKHVLFYCSCSLHYVSLLAIMYQKGDLQFIQSHIHLHTQCTIINANSLLWGEENTCWGKCPPARSASSLST